jgi:hypothetical protein
MTASSESCFSLPGVLLAPLNPLSKLAERYRRLPRFVSSVLAAAASFTLATIGGLLGAIAAMYLYDGANSKGNDFAVGLGGLFAVGTFIFVVLFTWLQKLHHPISSRTPLFAFFACLVLPVITTLASLEDIDDYYLPFVLGDWLAILLIGLLSLFVCRRWWRDSEQGF